MNITTESVDNVSLKTKRLLSERDAQSQRPIYFRAPSQGKHDPIFSLTRAKLYQLDKAKLISSVSLRERHQQRATRLFVTQSVADYIASCAARDETEAAGTGATATTTATQPTTTEGRAEA
jgi:hypothetical protein